MYKRIIGTVMAIIMAMILPITAFAEDNSDINLKRYWKITVNDYDDLYIAAKKELTKTYGAYNSAAYRIGHQIADQYNDEYSSVAINVTSTENPIKITKEYIDSLIAKWYVAGIFSDGTTKDLIDNEKFLQYLTDIDYDDIFHIGAPTEEITSSTETVTTTEDDPDGTPVFKNQDQDAESTSADGAGEETTSETTASETETTTSETETTTSETESTSVDSTTEESASETAAPDTETEETSSLEEATEETSEPEAEPSSENEALESQAESVNSFNRGGRVLMSAAIGIKKLPEASDLIDHYEKTVTVYTGTVYVNIDYDLNSIGDDSINAIIDEYGNDETFAKEIWDKVYELQDYLDVTYAIDTSYKTILAIAQDEADYYETDGFSGIREEYGSYFNVTDKPEDYNWSGIFLGYCAVKSRLTDKKMFPYNRNGLDPGYWVSYFSSDLKGRLYKSDEDQQYIPQKGDLVVYDNISDTANKYDQIGIVTAYESQTDTISTIEVRENKVVELTEIPRIEYREDVTLRPVCYIHPNYTSAELNYTWPLPETYTEITSYFQGDSAWRQSEDYTMHTGIDIYCPDGTPVAAVSDGTVVKKAYDDACGYFLIIEHSGIYSEYHHLDRFETGIEEGIEVSMGDVVAYSGSTGSAVTGPHLHYGLCVEYQTLWANNGADAAWTPGYINPLDTDALTDYFKAADDDSDIVNVAITQLGNIGGLPYWEYSGYSSRVEWCACFISWCADQCGYIDKGLFINTASPPKQVAFFRNEGHWMDESGTPSPGMIIFFDKKQVDFADHVGIVEYVEDGYVHTIEGNADDSVQRCTYRLGDSLILGYGWILDD